MLTLIALNGQDKGRVFQLTGEQPELLGRQAPNIRLADAQTSRRHAEVILQNNTWLVRDLGSTNGTWVNGQKITHITELEVGDRLVVGRHQFRVGAIQNLPAPTPQPKAPAPEPAIGNEDLAAMGVDLAESLSADLLDDDGQDVAEIPEDALGDSAVLTAPPADKPKAAAKQDDDDALIDLDALLGDETYDKPDASAESETPPEEPASAPAPEPSPVSSLDENEPIVPQPPAATGQHPPAPQDDFDIDALLGLGDHDAQPTPDDSATAQRAPVDDPEPTPELAENDDPTPTPAEEASADFSPHADGRDDSVLDLDAMLDGLASDEGRDVTDNDDPDDQLTTARPIDADIHDQQPALDEPTFSDELDDSPAPEGDSLIDIDILASAKPASAWRDEDENPTHTRHASAEFQIDAEPTADVTPSDDVDEAPAPPEAPDAQDAPDTLDDPAAGLDAAPDTAQPGDSGHIDRFQDDADEDGQPGEAADASTEAEDVDDDGFDDDDALGTHAPAVNEAEKGLLLSPQEQERAVTRYRRSKIKSFLGLVLLLGVLCAAGWYGFTYYVSRANATSTQPRQEPADPPDRDATAFWAQPTDRPGLPAPGETTDTQSPPDRPSDHTATPRAEDQPQPSDPLPAPMPRPTPEQAATPAPGPMAYPDPFADIAPSLTRPPPDQSKPDAPAQTNEQPPAQPPPTDPRVPAPDTALSPDDHPGTDDTPSNELATRATDETPGSTLDALDELAPAQVNPQPQAPQAELDIIAGVIDAQHKPGGRVADQADYAGARKVVYLVDASGSLVDSFPYVLSELNLAIEELTGDEAFTVIFFGSDGVTEVPPVGLKWADGQNKRHVRDWVSPNQGNVNAWGRGDLILALQRAVEYKPDDLVILSDNLTGRESSQQAVDQLLGRISEIVEGKVEKVHVTQFFDRDPQQVLKTIAERFHGRYSLIVARPSDSAQTAVDDPLDQP